MVLKTKIIIFFIIALTTYSLISCKKSKNDVIPDVYVSFEVDLNDPLFFGLNSISNSAIITKETNNWGPGSAGYDDNGIIVYNSGIIDYNTQQVKFNAYDRTCPHDFAVNGLSIKVNVDFTIAICPRCSTNYALSAFGAPISGPGKYPLKNYKTSFDGRYISVWNHL